MHVLIRDGHLDLDYIEDSNAGSDGNFVLTADGAEPHRADRAREPLRDVEGVEVEDRRVQLQLPINLKLPLKFSWQSTLSDYALPTSAILCPPRFGSFIPEQPHILSVAQSCYLHYWASKMARGGNRTACQCKPTRTTRN